MITQKIMDLIQQHNIELFQYLQDRSHQHAFFSEFKTYLEYEIKRLINELDHIQQSMDHHIPSTTNTHIDILFAIKNLFSDILIHAHLFDSDYITATYMLTTPRQFMDILEQIWQMHLSHSNYTLNS